MNPLEELLHTRNPQDRSAIVEQLYRYFPSPLARLCERYLVERHMRAIAPRIFFQLNSNTSWSIRQGGKHIAQSVPLDHLVRRIDRPVTIVASGPTARDHDWESARRKGNFVIAVAGATTLLKNVDLKPDLFIVSDSRFSRRGIEHFENASGVPLVTILRGASYMAVESPDELSNRQFSLIEPVNSWYGLPPLSDDALSALNWESDSPFLMPQAHDPRYRIGWSAAPELGFFSGTTVTFVALQIAVRLGARDIEIVGMDLSGTGRAYQEGERPLPNSLTHHLESVIRPSFSLMHDALKDSGIKIRNLSPVCPLPQSLVP